jgi:acyl-CoA reductase-like NAD-dependent aldehyde dehydrogenase
MSTLTPPETTEKLTRYQLYIGGEWVDAEGGATAQSINPYTGAAWAEIPQASHADVDRAVKAARAAFEQGPWPAMTGRDRRRLLLKLAQLVERDADHLARTETRDNGKLLREMAGQQILIQDAYEYFAGWADKIAGEVLPSDKPNFLIFSTREPIGVVAGITAWNSPLLFACFKMGPALATGCTVVLKPAEQTSASTLELAKLAEEAGFPPGVINVVTGGRETGASLVAHPGVDKVAFTGSTAAGVHIAKSAADNMTRVSLELGGKSPNIIFPDADLDAAATGAVSGIFAATGQTCVAGSRVLVDSSIADEFSAKFVEKANAIKLGDPTDPATEMGPVAFREQLDKVLSYIGYGIEDGAEVIAGGGQPKEGPLADGLFVEPTILAGLTNAARPAQEEIFGPVASVIPVRDEEDAVRVANDVKYGLAAGIWTRDVNRALRVAKRIRAGTVWINSYRLVSTNVPFGGFKMSGYGREFGLESVLDYTEYKAVWVETSGVSRDPFKLG